MPSPSKVALNDGGFVVDRQHDADDAAGRAGGKPILEKRNTSRVSGVGKEIYEFHLNISKHI